jgi:hypothetical protein
MTLRGPCTWRFEDTARRVWRRYSARSRWPGGRGFVSLGSGSILFIVGLLLSTGFLEPDVPTFWQDLLGNGVFLVIGWVGLWYPLDLLFFARQPLKREALIVKAISRMPLLVQPADSR